MTTINQFNKHYQYKRLKTLLNDINTNILLYLNHIQQLTTKLDILYKNTLDIKTAPTSAEIETIIFELINNNKKLSDCKGYYQIIYNQLLNVKKMLNITINNKQIINCYELEKNLNIV